MVQHKQDDRRWIIWLATAVAAPLAHFSGAGWAAVALASLAMLPLTLIPGDGWSELGRNSSILEFVWLAVTAGILLQNSGVYWPASHNDRVVPLILLALALWSQSVSAQAAGVVAGMSVAVLLVPVALAGVAVAEPQWLLPSRAGTWNGQLLITLLLPALGGIWNGEKKGRRRAALVCGATGVLIAALTQAALSPEVAAQMPDAFRQMSRSIGFAVVTRMEPVVAVAMTLGWYALGVLLLSAAVHLAEGFKMNRRPASLTCAGIASACVLLRIQLPDEMLVAVSILLWVVMPGCVKKYRFQKNKNST